MASTPPPRLVITEHRPTSRLRVLFLLLAWMASVLGAYSLGFHRAAPEASSLREDVAQLLKKSGELEQRQERLRQKATTLERSEQVERDAARALQATLAERDAELATLRNDVAFYERLAGGSAQRQPLTAHSLYFASAGDGGWRYLLTLTQNLKKAAVSKGDFTLAVEGSQDGKLKTLDWAQLKQSPEAAPRSFSFKYFQQVEGSIALPPGFMPHRVRIFLRSDQGRTEQVLPWTDEPSQGAS